MVFQGFLDRVQKVYIAYYGRPAEAEGLDFWAGRLARNNGDITAIIDTFANSKEFQDRFVGLENDALVKNFYQFLFNRDADADGLNFYVGKLNSGEMTLATVALDILNGARDTEGGTQDATKIANKVNVAHFFSDTTNRNNILYESGQIEEAANLLGTVTEDDASVQSAIESAMTLVESFPTYNKILGDDTDNILIASDGKDAFTGGGGADTFRFFSGASAPGGIDRITDFEIGRDRVEFVSTSAQIAPDLQGLDVTDKLPEFVGLGELEGSIQKGVFGLSQDVTLFSAHSTFDFALEIGLVPKDNTVALGFQGDTFVIQNENNQVFNMVWLVGVNIADVEGLSTGSDAGHILLA